MERFERPAWRHQLEDTASLLDHKFFGLLSEMGTGKSKIVVDAACFLREEAEIDTVLVVTPASVRDVWLNPDPEKGEIQKHAFLPSRVYEFHAKVRLAWQDPSPQLEWIVTNYEFIRMEKHRKELMKWIAGRPTLMVLDESSFVKSRTAEQTKACIEIGKTVSRRVILNGTPLTIPFDLWSQMNFLSPTILPYKNFYQFRAEYADMGGWHNHQVIRWKNLEKLQAFIAPHVVRREMKDCIDLPEKIGGIYHTTTGPMIREVPMDEKTWAIYKDMRDEAVVWMNDNPSLAAQAGVCVLRLGQITAGFLGGFIEEECLDCIEIDDRCPKHRQLEDDGPKAQEVSREKLDWLREFVTERLADNPTRKIIVWCRFRPEIERIAKDLKNLLPTYRLYGQTKKERDESINNFSARDGRPGLLAAHPQAGGFGLNSLVVADTVVYLSQCTLMKRLQSEGRTDRPGQLNRGLYLDILATGPKGQKTVDHVIFKSVRDNDDLSRWTMDAWRRAIMEE